MPAMLRWYHGALAVCSACELWAGGPSGAPLDGGTPPEDAATEAAPAQCTTPPSVCLAALPAGWTPLVRIDSNSACPSNFTQRDIVTSPMPLPGACTCACNIDTQPSCSKGQFDIKYGTNGCTTDWFLQANDGQCGLTNFVNVAAKNSLVAPTLVNGTCTAGTATGDPSKTTHKTARVCEVPMECQEDACEGKLAGIACIEHVGATACPAGDFGVPFGVYGDAVTVACSPCTGCDVAAQCGPGTLRYYSDSACTNQTSTVTMNGMCSDTNATNQTTYYKYDVPVLNVSCSGTGSTPTLDLGSKRSICCRM